MRLSANSLVAEARWWCTSCRAASSVLHRNDWCAARSAAWNATYGLRLSGEPEGAGAGGRRGGGWERWQQLGQLRRARVLGLRRAGAGRAGGRAGSTDAR
jgi:hypothetical protein